MIDLTKLPGMPQEKPKDLEGWVHYLNYMVGIGVMGIGVLYFIFVSRILNPLSWLYPAYFICFGLMLLSAQIEFDFINRNFKFLKEPYGRGLFTIYLGTLCLNMLDSSNADFLIAAFAWIACGVLCFIGIFHLIKGWKEKPISNIRDVYQKFNAANGQAGNNTGNA